MLYDRPPRMTGRGSGTRLDQRRARTRAALIGAARTLLVVRDAEEVSVQEITDAADVGFGTFYNHFSSKQQLFAAALDQVAEEHAAMLEKVTAEMADPAEAVAVVVRVTARLLRWRPETARVIDRAGVRYLTPASGPVLVLLRHLRAAEQAGRLAVGEAELDIACVAGMLLGVLHLGLTDGREFDIERAADGLAVNALRMFGMPEQDARAVVARPLPPIPWAAPAGPAAVAGRCAVPKEI
ncbi:helix-turn-helix domain-containing protein [Actinoplanes sp. NPDC023936]|uniref:TetR/AcrR family transcriptional regulator n=1 Tax=Actinoplanes sp. NPDC023936 TaxID=3154910 RepID=UPI0033F1097F